MAFGEAQLPRVLVFGHSHMGALLDAYRAEAAVGDSRFELIHYQFLREDRPHITLVDGNWRYHPECEEELRQLIIRTNPALIISMLQGEQAASAGMIAPDRPFEFYFPDETENGSGPIAEIIPFDAILAACMDQHRLISPLLTSLKPAMSVPAIALCPPPPIGDAQFILASRPKHGNISEYLATRGLPPTKWRYRMWKLHALALRAIYEEQGIVFIEPPSESYDESGCLLQSYWSDVFHANVAYGRLLLEQIAGSIVIGFAQ